MPDSPRQSVCQLGSTPTAIGVTAPSPVTTTRQRDDVGLPLRSLIIYCPVSSEFLLSNEDKPPWPLSGSARPSQRRAEALIGEGSSGRAITQKLNEVGAILASNLDRDLVVQKVVDIGTAALATLVNPELLAMGADDPMAPKSPHYKTKAKRIIFLFMKGGPSHVDTFDYKPRLQRDHGKPLPFEKPRVQFAETGMLLASPWKFRRRGQSGIAVSE